MRDCSQGNPIKSAVKCCAPFRFLCRRSCATEMCVYREEGLIGFHGMVGEEGEGEGGGGGGGGGEEL